MDDRERREPGKIRVVLDLIGDHPDELAFDFRSRFGLPLSAPFDGAVTWDEMWSLVSVLVTDPTAQTCAAVNGWKYPLSRESTTLAALYNATVLANTAKKDRKKFKPHPLPWADRDSDRSSKPTVGQDVIRAALARAGHKGADARGH